jgi:uncharacterized protein
MAPTRSGETRVNAPTSRRGHKVIDSDVHLSTRQGLASVANYLPRAWYERFVAKGMLLATANYLSPRFNLPNGGGGVRADSYPPAGGPGGSDLDFMTSQFLDGWAVDIAVASCLDVGVLAAGLAGPDESIVLCRAFNDYMLDEFAHRDHRIRLVITATPQDPPAAAAEIRRLGADATVCGVFLPLMNVMLGNRVYDPIFAAAQEFNLPIFIHVTNDFASLGLPVAAGGHLENFTERRVLFSQIAQSSVSSLVFTGALERFPDLNFAFVEYGFSWLLPLLWRMDSTWSATRIEVPWVKKWPSEYVHERMRFATQPVDEPRAPTDLARLIEMLGDDVLIFSSDYPHWDNDDPDKVLQSLPIATRERMYWTNPAAFWRL